MGKKVLEYFSSGRFLRFELSSVKVLREKVSRFPTGVTGQAASLWAVRTGNMPVPFSFGAKC